MKIKLMISALIIMVVIGSCKNNTPSAAKTEEVKKDSAMTTQIDTSIYRLAVLFYSIGEGVESEYINALKDSINGYSTEVGKPIDYKLAHWGREGETDFIFRLDELNPSQQVDFVTRTKSMLKKAKWVHIYENYSYRFRPGRPK